MSRCCMREKAVLGPGTGRWPGLNAWYLPLGDAQRLGWKQANETVNRIGGWRTYLREAQQPDPAPTAPAGRAASAPAPIPAPAPAPAHGGHAKH